MSETPIHETAAAYGRALKAAMQPLRDKGWAQYKIAERLHVAPGTLSRYLSGQRIAEKGLIEGLAQLLEEKERSLSQTQFD
ncbi:multiprotein-bridging factor 1 family protein [Streptomyces sp. NPDC050523]|uniref:multiprotein-bridging factor 1 family protein n=1 Tax=Streptomyces sp. NPDC050523 TaxID=3365622 RepID=UPI0037AF299B